MARAIQKKLKMLKRGRSLDILKGKRRKPSGSTAVCFSPTLERFPQVLVDCMRYMNFSIWKKALVCINRISF